MNLRLYTEAASSLATAAEEESFATRLAAAAVLSSSIKDRPGALYSILRSFSRHKINLTKIESRPSRRKAWEYIFFVDMKGHVEDKEVKKAINEVTKECLYLKVLGSYPSAE